jgi:hypothetical protein
MRKSAVVSCIVACGFAVAACGGDDDDTAAGSGGSSAGSGGSSGSSGGAGSGGTAVEEDPINPSCPQNDIGPTSGPYAQKGACCYRTSNHSRVDAKADERTLEFRTNYFYLTNHQKTVDPLIIGPMQIGRLDNEEQSVLMRYRFPQKDGKVTAGKGHITLGVGRYNCDGKYSFYSDKAAPGDMPDRWYTPEFDADVNPDKTDQDLIRPSYKGVLPYKNKLSYLPTVKTSFELEWEAESQGFDIIQMPTGPDNLDCVGSRTDAGKWKAGGKSIAFSRLDLNAKSRIEAVGESFCQLLAFGASSTAKSLDCEKTERCEPGQSGCAWVRLPDSLCPANDDEASKWGCHLGYGDNPDNGAVKLNCSKEPISEVDPDTGTSEGRCCDPLGKGTDGLPACNAWLQISDFVAAAVEITDDRSDKLQESCHGKP